MAEAPDDKKISRSGPLTDLALTLPIFIGYHLGVVFLPVRNAADWVTRELQLLAEHNLLVYAALTLALGAAYVTPLVIAGRGRHLRFERFAWIGTEGVAYAIGMRLLAGYAVAHVLSLVAASESGFVGLMNAAPALSSSVEVAGQSLTIGGRLAGAIMSLGAGFYEELVFRVGIYGAGATLLLFLLDLTGTMHRFAFRVFWAVLAAGIFSGWHYVGALGDDFDLMTFVFRGVCGLVFTVIYHFRGFAPAVWTHALYDIWVLAIGN